MSRPVSSILYRHRFSSMGCPAEVALYAADRETATRAFGRAESEVHRLDRKYSHYRNDSGLAHILQLAAREQGVQVDEETAGLLNYAATQYRESAGRFDITAGRLTALWDRVEAIPKPDQIAAALALTGWHRVGWDGHTLQVPQGMRLDLGGVVKEYAADRAALQLKSAGIHSGYVDLGGDLHILGPHPDGSAWRVGVRNPRGTGAIAEIPIIRGGLATSGDYERCLEVDGQRFGHIINPLTGWPVQGLASVSVAAPSCLVAGAVSTLAMLQGRNEGLAFLSACGLQWMAHDGRFSWPRKDCMLEETKPFPPSQPERNASHASTQSTDPISNSVSKTGSKPSPGTRLAGDFLHPVSGSHQQLVATAGG